MGISRFEKFAPVTFENTPIFTPDVESLGKVMKQVQTEYDTGKAAFADAAFKNLEADSEAANALRESQDALGDDITNQFEQSVGQGRRAMSAGLRALQKDYKEGGRRYALNRNYAEFTAENKRQQARIGKPGGITLDQHENWKAYTLNNYAQKGGATQDEFGDWSTVPMGDIAKYVDGADKANKFGMNFKANKIKTGQWYKDPKNGLLMRKKIGGDTRVTEEEIMKATVSHLQNDPEFIEYLEQVAEHTGQPLNLNNIGEEMPDGSFAWNYDNKLVDMAITPAIKYSYTDIIDDEGIQASPQRNKSGGAGGGEPRREDQLMNNAIVYGANTTKKLEDFKSSTDIKTTLAKYDDEMKALDQQYSQTNITPGQRALNREKHKFLRDSKRNLEIARDELLEERFPEISAAKTELENTLETYGIPERAHQLAMEAATAKAAQSGTNNPAAVMQYYNEIIKASVGVDIGAMGNQNQYGGNRLQHIATLNSRANYNNAAVDKAIESDLRQSVASKTVPQAEITIDGADTYREVNGKVTRKGARGKVTVEEQLVNNPGAFIYDVEGVGPVDGNQFRAKMQEQHEGVTFDWNTQTLTTFIPSNDYHQDGSNMKSIDKSKVSVRVKDAAGNDGTITFKIGYSPGTGNLKDLVINDLRQHSSSQPAIELLNRKVAQNNWGTNALAKLETGNTSTVLLSMPPQVGDADLISSPDVIVNKVSGEGKVADSYVVNFGSYNKEYPGDWAGAELHAKNLRQIAVVVQQYQSATEATNDVWRGMSSRRDPLFQTKEQLNQFITHLKQR